MSRQRTRNLFKAIISKSLKQDEKLSVSEWAEKYRVLDESSNFKGKWSNDITPYLTGIMDSFNNPYVQEINFVKPTQVGGTECMFNILGWIIMNNPSPTMIVYPTDELAKNVSNMRLKPSLLKTPEIANRFHGRQSKNLNIKFRGMHLLLSGTGKPEKLASHPMRFLFFDEIDKMGGATKKEASPYNLAKERTKTFKYSKKIYTCSTPTLKTNYVWMIHEMADAQFNFFCSCPHCNTDIVFRWKQIIFDKEGEIDKRSESAVYVCQECGCEITDHDKIKMLRRGQWKTVTKKCIGQPRKVSYWINALYSRFLSWSDIVREFLESKDDPDRLQNFVNSWLAEPWENTKLKTDENAVLKNQTELPEFVVPGWTKILTGGVDVQETSVYWTIRAYGDYITSQNIAHGQVLNLQQLEDIMNREYVTETGEKMQVMLCGIDSGFDTDTVYDFCMNNSDWAIPVKGSSRPMQSHYKITTVNATGRKAFANGLRILMVDGGKYKDMIAARLLRTGAGAWMVYKDCDLEYAKQVTSEHKVKSKDTGQEVWVTKTTHADNHYLDTEVYSIAAADLLGVRGLHLQGSDDEEAPATEQKKEEASPEESWISKNESWI